MHAIKIPNGNDRCVEWSIQCLVAVVYLHLSPSCVLWCGLSLTFWYNLMTFYPHWLFVSMFPLPYLALLL